MSNKSGTSSQVISLPKGGGALQGIGEKFSPDLHTGTGNFTVPIALPPGRNGFQPQLNLVYSTGNGAGPFGLGWSLSVPGVSRKTSDRVPVYRDDEDTFVLSGAEDLVPVETSADENAEQIHHITRYRPRTEGLFARIEHHRIIPNDDGTTASDYWRVQSKDGLTSHYGTETQDRPLDADEDWRDPAVIADPSNLRKIFSWQLTKTEDPFGNRIVYEYDRDTGQTGEHHWDQLYLERIRYVDYRDDADRERFLVLVTFEYEELAERYEDEVPDVRRLYPFSTYRAGFEIRTRRRCTRIAIRTHADSERLVRTYDLVYLDQRDDRENLEELLPRNGVSLLSQMVVTGHDGDRVEELPPLEFGYTRFDPERRDFYPLEGRDRPARSLTSPDLELADMFGNGLPDILEMNGAVRYWRNLGDGRFDLPRPMRDAPAGLSLADPDVQLIDADGDGRIDLLVNHNDLSGYFPLQFTGEWDRRSFRRYRQAPSFSLEDPEVKLVDLNGDGVTDAIRSGSRLECFFNDPREGWNGTRWVERRTLEVFPDINFSDPRVKWGDMSGDGLQDIVLVHDGNVEYWPNLGHGQWGNRVHMFKSPRFPYDYDPRRLLVGDVDGDGLADLVYVDHCQLYLYINQSGNGWSEPIVIDGTPPVTDMDAVRLVDLLGTGVSGVLWSADAKGNGFAREHAFFHDFTGGSKPYLLDEMDNHMGAVTRVAYRPSTQFYLADWRDPAARWQTPLPFPVQVVACVEVIDQISKGKLTTEYRYHHGYWDGAEREFRGFGRVEQFDTEDFDAYHSPGLHEGADFVGFNVDEARKKLFSQPTLTKTWFHQGPIGPEHGDWVEADYSHEYWPGDPQMLERPADLEAFMRDGSIARRVKRDALRTLRGRILRTELYALDGNERQDRPYTDTEAAYSLREEMPPNTEDRDRQRIFFPFTVAQRTTQWERGDDPMTQFSFVDDYDPYGQARQATAVALPRRQAKRQPLEGAIVGVIPGDEVNETRVLATHARTEYAAPDPGVYIHDRAAQVRAFELRTPPEVTESDPADLARVLRDQKHAAKDIQLGFRSLLASWSPGEPLPPELHHIAHTVTHYDGDAFAGRPPGELGPFGALTRSEALAFSDDELDAAYGDRRPTYLGGTAAPPPGAPPDFGTDLGYRLERDAPIGYHAGYYADTQRQQFDFQDSAVTHQRGVVTGIEDPLAHRTTITLDAYALLPTVVADPVGLETQAVYDYRVLQPSLVTDPNRNRARFTFAPLGLPKTLVVQGKPGEEQGDTQEQPGTVFRYDFLAFYDSDPDARQPISVHTVQRQQHRWDLLQQENARRQEAGEPPLTEAEIVDLFPGDLDEEIRRFPERFIQSREYSDGLGRLVQTRAQAEELVFGASGDDVGLPSEPCTTPSPANGQRLPDRVVVSGWQIYDNKGRAVEGYEPFFSQDWDLQPEAEAKRGQHATLFYDPRGQVIRTLNPDGSEQRVLFGVPGTVASPDVTSPALFEPTPWETYAYDANDLAPLSQFTEPDGSTVSLAGRAPEAHHFTPTNALVDGLGRTITTVGRNRFHQLGGAWSPVEVYLTRSTYDVRGNLLLVTDALGRDAFRYRYDLLNNPLRVDNIDAGLRTSVLDATGNLVEYRDSKGSVALRQHDLLNRLTHLWARDDGDGRLTLRERLEYADACVYYGRCPAADKELGCDRPRPPLVHVETDHAVACFRHPGD